MAARRSRGRWLAKGLATVVLALLLGVGSAWWRLTTVLERGGVANGPWLTNVHIGSPSADPALRAGVALAGLLALGRSETIYYTAQTDGDGAALRAECS